MKVKCENRRFGIIEKLDVQRADSGKLAGKTFVAKDLFDIAGHVTGAGSPDWSSKQTPVRDSAQVIETLLADGARLIGKSQTDELACSLDGINIHYGIPENSQMPDRIPGGSSSGSASAVAAGLCHFALGTDTVGSTRVPASYCGLYGFRPTHELVSLKGVRPLAPSFDTVGWMSGDAELLEVCGGVLLDRPRCSHPLGSICILDSVFENSEPSIRDSLKGKAKEIASLFKSQSSSELSAHAADILNLVFNTIRTREAWDEYGKWIETEKPHLSPTVKARLEEGKAMSAQDEQLARELKKTSTLFIDDEIAKHGILCFPTTWGLPPGVDSSIEDLAANRRRNLQHTIFSVVSGLPEVTVPIKVKPNVSIGLSFLGPRGSDMQLLNLAALLAEKGFSHASTD